MKISVIVPTFNGGELLRATLSSISALDFPESDFEVIVVDNNSTDNSVEIIESFPFIKIHERERQGSYAARNAGLKVARGELIAFTDSDCEVHPNWLNALYEAAQSNPEAGCIAGEILAFPAETTVERFSEHIGLLRQKGPLSGWHFKPYAQTANAAFRRVVFNLVGGFDPDLKSGGDATMAWRMLDSTDYKLAFEPNAIVYHHHRTDIASLWSQFRRYGGGKISWARLQPDYDPPKVKDQEDDLVLAMNEFLTTLEKQGLDEEVFVYPLLSMVTKAAHLDGYLQDLLRHITGEQDANRWPAIAAGRSAQVAAAVQTAQCTLCNGRSFNAGPLGRLANGLPPQCESCGSLERHRVLKIFEPELVGRGLERRQLFVGETPPEMPCTAYARTTIELDENVRGSFDSIIVSARPHGGPASLKHELAYYTDRMSFSSLLVLFSGASSMGAASRINEDGKPRFDADAAWRCTRILPEYAVLSARLPDPVTRDSCNVTLISRDGPFLRQIAEGLESRGGSAFVISL